MISAKDFGAVGDGALFTCRAKQLNLSKTGETYNLDDYPTLRGFV